jgi:hypothetical protein
MRILFLVVALLFASDALAQGWTLRLDEGPTDSAYDVAALPDGGFVAVGYTSGPSPSLDAFAVRTDASGEVVWTRRIERSAYSERAYRVLVLPDGDLLLIGTAYFQATAGNRGWMVRLTASGDVVYVSDESVSLDLPATVGPVVGSLRPDGLVMLAGTTPNTAPVGARPWVAVVDPSGPDLITVRVLPALEQQIYGGTQVSTIVALDDGGAVVAGQVGAGPGQRGYLWRLTAEADSMWASVFPQGGLRTVLSARALDDGGLLVSGCGGADCGTAMVLRTDANGDAVWTSSYPTDTGYGEARDVAPLDDGSALVLRTRYHAAGTQAFDTDLLTIDASGVLADSTTLPGNRPETGGSLRLERMVEAGGDGWYVAAGQIADAPAFSQTDLYVVREQAPQAAVSSESGPARGEALTVSPNPASHHVRLEGVPAGATATVYDFLGRRVLDR